MARIRTHPGEILREEFMMPLGLSANALALALRVPTTRIGEAGCTIHEIASVTGHATLREIQRCTDAADRERAAVKAIASISQMNEAEK